MKKAEPIEVTCDAWIYPAPLKKCGGKGCVMNSK
jgi:hypothetical protein